jgi:hypothetical protein
LNVSTAQPGAGIRGDFRNPWIVANQAQRSLWIHDADYVMAKIASLFRG